jgi:hypothetical protein
MRNRVENQSDDQKTPSEEDDWHAFQEEFDCSKKSVSRGEFQQIRKELTPPGVA